MPMADVVQLMMELLGVDAGEAWTEVEKTKGGHAQFNFLKDIFKERLLEAQEAYYAS